MSREKLIIAHCSANVDVAREIAHQLQQTDFDFELVSCGEQNGSIKETIGGSSEKIILLLSDNFLKSMKCMDGGLMYLQKLINAGKTLPVVIDGKYKSQDGKGFVTVPTKFERVSSVIKYMNFWQDEYLEMRKKKRSIPADEEVAFTEQLKSVRTISSEVGEFLRFLRDSYSCDYPTLSSNDFQIFFQKFSDQPAHNSYVEQVAKNPITSILGTGEALGSAAVVSNMATNKAPEIEEIVAPKTVPQVVQPKEIKAEDLFEQVESAEKVPIDLEEKEIDGIVEEILLEENAPPKEAAANSDTELLAQQLAEKLPATNVPAPTTIEPETELIDVETALEDLSKQQREDLSNQQTAQEEAIMQDGLDMLGVTGVATAAGTVARAVTSRTKVVSDRATQLISESDLLRSSHEIVQKGQLEEGLALLKTNLQARPDMIAARYQYSVFLAQFKNNYKEASSQLKKILLLDSNNLPANFFLGELAEAQGDFLSAKNYYETVKKINPNFPNLHYKLGLLLGRRYKDQAPLAANHLHEAYAQNPRNIDALYNWGLVQNESLKQPKASLSAFMKVAAEDPKHPFVNYDIALAYYKLNDREQAYSYYEKACAINAELRTPENDLAFAIPEEVVSTLPSVNGTALAVNQAQEAAMEVERVAMQPIENSVKVPSSELLTMEQPDYTLDLSGKEEIQLEDLIIEEEIDSKEDNEPIVDEEQLEAEFDATIGALGAAGLGIAAGAAINGQAEEVEETIAPIASEKQENRVTKTPTKIVLITGATSGIGKATAAIFAEKGYDLILTGRRFSRLLQLKEEFSKEFDSNIQLLPFDVRSAAAVQTAIEELPDVWKNVEVLINNAGLALGFSPIHEGSLEDWETMIDTNIKGLLYMTRAIAPHMVKQKKGHIINISSIAGKEVYPNGNVYCASKHAVEALTKAMRIDLHKYNIRVSQVAPGHVEETEFAKVRFHGDTDRAKIYEDFVPVNSRDIAETIHFIASRPPHVNIQDILVMGTQQASALITDRSGR